MSDLKPPLEGFSIWLLPKQEQLDLLQAMTDELASMGSSSSFLPHATVLGLLRPGYGGSVEEVIEGTKLLSGCPLISTEAVGVGRRDQYFQSLFLPLVPTVMMAKLYLSAQQSLDVQPEQPLFFHLSAAYGDFDREQKQGMARIIESNHLRFPYTVTFDRIAAVSVNGYPHEWQILEEWPLRGEAGE